jgi:sugar phosphate isomerase/epimerase
MGNKRIIGVTTNCYHGYSIDEALAGISAAGFRYVELTAAKGWTEHVFSDKSFEELYRVRKLLEDTSLSAFAMSGHVNLMDKSRLEDFKVNMQLAKFFGCDYIVSSIGEAHLEDKEVVGNEQLIANIKTLLEDLDKNDLTLALELHGDHATGEIMSEIVDSVKSDLVTINYDTANAIFYGDVDPDVEMQAYVAGIGYMHLKDKAGERNEWNFPALGKGYVNFPHIFDTLEGAGNACPFSVEIEFTQSGPENLDEVNTAVRDSADYLLSRGMVL